MIATGRGGGVSSMAVVIIGGRGCIIKVGSPGATGDAGRCLEFFMRAANAGIEDIDCRGFGLAETHSGQICTDVEVRSSVAMGDTR